MAWRLSVFPCSSGSIDNAFRLALRSGGAATAVWRFCETGELDPEKDKPFLNKKEQLDEIKALQDESEGILLSFFNVGADAMNTVILKAIVNNLTTDSAARKTAELRGDDPDDGPDTRLPSRHRLHELSSS